MTSVAEVALLPGSFANQAVPRDPASAAREVDTMFLQLLLQQSGLLRAFGSEEGASSALFGEMMLPVLARELAAQLGPGFGSLWLQQLQILEGETVK